MLRQLNRFWLFSMSSLLLSLSLSARAQIVPNPPKEGTSSVSIEFIYDYQCPYCHAMTPDIEKLVQAGMTVKWMPVALIHNPLSLEEATGAIASTRCAGGFDRYQQITELNPVLSTSQVDSVTAYVNQQCPGFKNNQHASWVKNELDNNTAEMHKAGAEGVPVTVIYATTHPEKRIVLQGEQSSQTLREAIDEAAQQA